MNVSVVQGCVRVIVIVVQGSVGATGSAAEFTR